MIKDTMTSQEVFDHVVNHMRQQGRQCGEKDPHFANGIRCFYRDPDNLKCAVGCLIKDEEYQSVFEKQGGVGGLLEHLVTSSPILYQRLHPHHSILRHLQSIHDNYSDPADWEIKFNRTAETFGLKVPPKET